MSHSAGPRQQDAASVSLAPCWTEVAELTSRCARLLQGGIEEQAARHGLGCSQFSVLHVLAQDSQAGLSQNELAGRLELSPAHVSGMVEQLRRQQLVEGHRRPPDRRRQVWTLTRPGDDRLRNVLCDLLHWATPLEQRFGLSRREALTALLRELSDSRRQAPGPRLFQVDEG